MPQDYVLAHKWFNLAATGGYEIAAKLRDKSAKQMTPEQIAEGQKLSREIFERIEKNKAAAAAVQGKTALKLRPQRVPSASPAVPGNVEEDEDRGEQAEAEGGVR